MEANEKKNRIRTFLISIVRGKPQSKKNILLNEDKELQKRIFIILVACHIGAFVQSCAYFIQNTAFPYLTKELHVSPQVYGYVISLTAILQLIGGPLCGRLGDIYGGRLTLIISFLALAISYSLLSISTNIPMLFISRISTIAAHALQSTYMIISDVTFEEERANMIGKIGVSHGLGMIVGSGIGGFITDKFGIRPAIVVAIFVVLICAVVAFIMIPRDTKAIRTILDETRSKTTLDCSLKSMHSVSEQKQGTSSFGLKEIIAVAKTKHMIYLLAIKTISGFPFSVLGAMFTLILMDYYMLGPKDNGIVLSYLGVVGMITQGYLVGVLTHYVNDADLILIAIMLMAAGSLFLIISQSIVLFCVVAIPLTIGGSLLHIIITSLITKIVPKDKTGSALGLTMCTHAIIRTFSPTIGGFLFQHIGFYSFGLLGYVINLSLVVYLIFYGRIDFEA
ncbi:solute carrier family 22 member 18-like [Hydractinia symbiolongicarpus]|uniref:solute carrier family 22 member 18-like n=1 Tax=Hydractinia symbiolongicarpus TaxID=13093 RepID=UPI00254E4408|nr:solute carrier family 22 member 18-like [Hydractinia symbiolongicarpus]